MTLGARNWMVTLGWTSVLVSFDVPAGAKWLKANVDMNGFYRVQYTERNWRALISQLKDDHTVRGVEGVVWSEYMCEYMYCFFY